jgi:HD superfamily phosphodiesterase
VLGPGLTPLFETMSERDQRHCLDVYERLRAAGCEDRNVLIAALLHDAGKGSLSGTKIQLWHRVAYVLAENAPEAVMRTACDKSLGLEALRVHAARGMELAEEYGAPAEVLRLLHELEDEESGDEKVAMLRAADEES